MDKKGVEGKKDESNDEDVGPREGEKRGNNYTQIGGSSSSGGNETTAGRRQEKRRQPDKGIQKEKHRIL